MTSKIKDALREWIPPVLVRMLTRGRGIYWSGDYPSWGEAERASTGYDDRHILERVKQAALKVKGGEATYERDSVLFYEAEFSWPLVAGLLRAAGKNGNRLSVLDFGGALGSTYYQNRKFLAVLNDLRWSIVEQESYVECGKRHFQEGPLHFYSNIEACLRAGEQIDLILISSVLPYLESPYDVLGELMCLGIGHMIIDRTPFLLSDRRDRLTVERVPPEIYDASYPAWFFNKRKFLDFVQKGYRVVAEFEGFDHANIASQYKGFILDK